MAQPNSVHMKHSTLLVPSKSKIFPDPGKSPTPLSVTLQSVDLNISSMSTVHPDARDGGGAPVSEALGAVIRQDEGFDIGHRDALPARADGDWEARASTVEVRARLRLVRELSIRLDVQFTLRQ
jgi:hypothetical protein